MLERWIKSERSRKYHGTYMSPESQIEMIHLLAEDVRRQVAKEIKDASMFSVSADTTPLICLEKFSWRSYADT